MSPDPSCLVPRFDGVTFSLEWKEALWDKFYTAAPRTVARQGFALANHERGRTLSEPQYSDPLADR